MREIYVVKLGYSIEENRTVRMAFESREDAESIAGELGEEVTAMKMVEGDPYATYNTKAMMKGAEDAE